MQNTMRHNIVAAIATTVAISCVALAVSPAMAQEATPSAPPSAQAADAGAANYKRLTSLRSSIASLRQELESPNLSADARTNLQRDLSMLSNDMKDYAAERASTTERIPVDHGLLRIATRTAVLRSAPSADRAKDLVSQYIESVKTELRERGSGVDISFEAPLSFVRITGFKWEVEEAKLAFRDALPQYIERAGQLEEAERADLMDREKLQFWNFERSTVTIDWKGGPLRDLIAEIQTRVPCNVVLAEPSVGELVIPALAVARVAPDVFYRSLQSIPLAADARLAVTVVAPEATEGSKAQPAMLTTLPVIVIAQNARATAPSTSQTIFDLSDWRGANADGVKELIEAINFAVEASDQGKSVKVRYHEPTKILFAKGPADSIALIAQVVDAIRSQK
jgi:hypothetical protein